ncbi:MAG TPA: hypothetical protein VMM76_16525 [Pirellulaceae bacterium]|nr:hypothetical protein [Pirellulaceae bacterium]
MRIGTTVVSVSVVLSFAFGLMILNSMGMSPSAWGCGRYDDMGVREIRLALSAEGERRVMAVARLRERGPAAVEHLLALRDQVEANDAAGSANDDQGDRSKQRAVTEDLVRLDALIDEVGGQRNCASSRLFWYTDLEAAKAAAVQSGRPILSLRMLGQLTDEFSCANSRFFRSTLYSNAEISGYLRDHFVLHWQSVRPVPKVTLDFGDGRRLERTLTGNSAHYILHGDGQPIDCLPGLYGPGKFLEFLQQSEAVARRYAAAPAESRETLLKEFHAARLSIIAADWSADLQAIQSSAKLNQVPSNPTQAAAQPTSPPNAEAAGLRAVPKSLVEMPLIRAVAVRNYPVTESAASADWSTLESSTSESLWRQIAERHASEAVLDPASVRVIRQENPLAAAAGELSFTKTRVEDPILRLVRSLQSSIALDTVRNEYNLHRKIHEWFVNDPAPRDVVVLNERVYAELFLTPSSDPWLGLLPPDTYTALQNDGLVISTE